MKHPETALVILAALYSSLALGDDFKTIGGKEYKGATVSRIEPGGIVLRTKSGISKVNFVELPRDIQERFQYDAAKGNAYSAEQNAAQEQLRKQQEEALRQKAKASNPVTADPARPVTTAGIQTLPQNKTATAADQVHRIGAICRDGSESGATGRGACSHHGGVKCWKLSDGTCH